MNKALAIVLLLAATGCESSMREPPPIKSLAPNVPHGLGADELVAAADAAWARRAEPDQAGSAQDAYLAAAATGRRIDALLGAMRAIHYRVEYESGIPKGALTRQAVDAGQWCMRLSPGDAACMYRLAIALGQEAREHPLEAKDALAHMIDLLHHAIAADPSLDSGGPHRVLALVLLRAPSWPGPGDAEAGLAEARAAVAIAPDAAENELALGEALAANDAPDEARAAYRRAITLAESVRDPEAVAWRSQARAGLSAR